MQLISPCSAFQPSILSVEHLTRECQLDGFESLYTGICFGSGFARHVGNLKVGNESKPDRRASIPLAYYHFNSYTR